MTELEGVCWDAGKRMHTAQIPQSVLIFGGTYLGQYINPIMAGEVVQEGLEIVRSSEDHGVIRRLLEELQESCSDAIPNGDLPKGVYYCKDMEKIVVEHLGDFDTLEEALSAHYKTSQVGNPRYCGNCHCYSDINTASGKCNWRPKNLPFWYLALPVAVMADEGADCSTFIQKGNE